MGDLKQYSYAVTGLTLGIFSGAVFQCLNDLQGAVNDSSFLKAVNVYDSADTAVVML